MKLSADSQAYEPPQLYLGYRPVRLRFLAQGSAPYTVAFGSRRAEIAAPARCDALLAGLGTRDLAALVVEGFPSATTALGGDAAYKAPPKRTPVRLVILWGANPIVTHHHLWKFVEAARRRGGHAVVIDPVRSPTADRADEQGASGLGLATSRAIVEAHHGRIEASRSPIGGLRVTVILPAEPPRA